MTSETLLLTPAWSAPANVRAFTTMRGAHSDFDLSHPRNRQRLNTLAGLPSEPIWLKQIHGDKVIQAKPENTEQEADASFSNQRGVVCAILTADCLPILLCHQDGSQVAAIHAGWRSLAAGIIQQTLTTAGFTPGNTLAWLGPAIGPSHFEVGEEVRTLFLLRWPDCAAAFAPSRPGHWMANLCALAHQQLDHLGINKITHSNRCTFTEKEYFFSWRRAKDSGRMATLIWME